jgi:hypothetical protein
MNQPRNHHISNYINIYKAIYIYLYIYICMYIYISTCDPSQTSESSHEMLLGMFTPNPKPHVFPNVTLGRLLTSSSTAEVPDVQWVDGQELNSTVLLGDGDDVLEWRVLGELCVNGWSYVFSHITNQSLAVEWINHETEGLQNLHDFTWGCSWGYFSGHTNNIL